MAETKNTLSLALFLASCIFWVGQDDAETGPKRERLYLWSLAFFLLAMFAKTSVVAMPVLTLLHAWWKRGTVTLQDAVRAAPMFLVSIVLGIVTMQYQWGRAIGVETLPVGGIDSRIATAGMAILFYLATIVWPVHLVPMYPRWDVDPPRAWQFLPWIAIGGAAWWLWKNRETTWGKNCILAFGFFLLMIAPVLGFVDISYMRITWVADHFLYLPMIGPLTLLVATAATWMEKREEREHTVFTAAVAAVMLFLAVNAFLYSFTFASGEQYCDRTVAYNDGAWLAHNRLGLIKLQHGDVDAALYHCNRAIQLRPELGETWNQLSLVLQKKGEVDEAIEVLQRAVSLSPDPVIRRNLADMLLSEERYEDAREQYEALLEVAPNNPTFLNKHALALFKLGEREKAISEFRRALEIDPSFSDAAENLKVAIGISKNQPPPPAEK